MKLSEIKGERVFDVLADVIAPVATIAKDKDAIKLFSAEGRPEDVTPWDWFVERATIAMPVILKTYRTEICQIMAAINDVPVEEYVEGITIQKLLKDTLDLVTDSEFVSFFS